MGCLICESDRVEVKYDSQFIKCGVIRLNLKMEYSVCQNCGYDYVTTEQIKRNDKAVALAKKEYHDDSDSISPR